MKMHSFAKWTLLLPVKFLCAASRVYNYVTLTSSEHQILTIMFLLPAVRDMVEMPSFTK